VPESGRASGDALVTLRLKRTHIFGAILFLAGVLVGLVAYRLLDKPDFVTLPSSVSDALVGGQSVAPAGPSAPSEPVSVEIAGRPSWGPLNADVTVVEFLDYQCPFCERHFREVYPELQDRYEGRIKYVVRNFPLPAVHPLAIDSAVAAECAGDQGKYFEFHDALFENQARLGDRLFTRLAQDLELDMSEFEDCLSDPAIAERIDKDVADARSYGVTGTPTFFINGRLLAGAQQIDAFVSVIEEELEAASAEG
jgi:protein-disulfide isomerase